MKTIIALPLIILTIAALVYAFRKMEKSALPLWAKGAACFIVLLTASVLFMFGILWVAFARDVYVIFGYLP